MNNNENLKSIINSFANEYDIDDTKKLFFLAVDCFLISRIRTKKNNGDNILNKVYPYILDSSFNYDSDISLELIDFFSKIQGNDVIGDLYECSLSAEKRKDFGQFYTRSNDVVSYMVDMIDTTKTLQILEPSSGSGLFLIEIVKRKLKNINDSNIESTLQDIFNNVNANDLDPLACKITEVNILIQTIEYIKKAYDKNNHFTLPKLKISCSDFCKYNKINAFDIVISNPPYVTMYGRRSRNMTEEKRKEFNKFDFVINKNGNNKFNLVMFFIENGLKTLKQNGKLIFIIDISFFETAFIDIRKYILENCFIESITTNLNEFDNVASGQIVISLVKSKQKGITKWYDFKDKSLTEINQEIWYNEKNKFKIYIPLSNTAKNIDDKMKQFKKLEYYYPDKALRTCCALTGKTDEFMVSKDKETKNYIFPYLEGSKGIPTKFAIPCNTKYLEYNYDLQIKLSDEFKIELEKLGIKNKKRVTLGDKDAYLSPKLFIRQSANDIIATYTDKPYSANNSIYILTNKKNDIDSINLLKYTCGILNSDLITFFSRANNIIRRGNGKTPQIKTSDLKQIPICVNEKYYNEIITIVDNISLNYSEELYRKLNQIIYSIYGINDNEIKFIENYLKEEK